MAKEKGSRPDLDCKVLFAVIAWSVWKDHNKMVFTWKPSDPMALVIKIISLMRLIHKNDEHPMPVAETRHEVSVSWFASVDSVKLNVDGYFHHVTWNVPSDGLIRDCIGLFVQGFTSNLGKGSSIQAEVLCSLLEPQVVSRFEL
ncbi:hypothetical protein SESBI_02441 [Sesbania bispinosa]|nr:hypothetical protein SESBI_02441 [Sesbania bispinosa]